MSTRVIVHPAPDSAEDGIWDVYVEGHADPFRLKTMADLNAEIGHLGLKDCVYYPASFACDGKTDKSPCWLAATGTILWAGPGEFHAAHVCDAHREEGTSDAVRLGYPYTLICAAVPLSRLYFSKSSHADMADLARDLVGYEVPGDVYRQPVCAGCGERICLPAGSLQWADAGSEYECAAGGTGHLPAVAELTAAAEPADLSGKRVQNRISLT